MLITDKTLCLLRPIAGLGIHLPLPGIRIGIVLSREGSKIAVVGIRSIGFEIAAPGYPNWKAIAGLGIFLPLAGILSP